jgi:hypothetical protein
MQAYTGQCLAYQPANRAGLEMDWRKREMVEVFNVPCPRWPEQVLQEMKTVREPAEAILSQLMVPDRPLPGEQADLLQRLVLQTDFDDSLLYGTFYVVAAYWRARRGQVNRDAKTQRKSSTKDLEQ